MSRMPPIKEVTGSLFMPSPDGEQLVDLSCANAAMLTSGELEVLAYKFARLQEIVGNLVDRVDLTPEEKLDVCQLTGWWEVAPRSFVENA